MELTTHRPIVRAAWMIILLTCIAVASVACRGGGGGPSDRVDSSKIPTQTLPSTLPDPIIVSGPGGRGTPTPVVPTDAYTVSPGDTLAAIAARFNTTVEEIARTNNITDIGRLEVGQRLNVPRVGTATPTASRTPTPAGTGTATVRSGTVTPTPTGAAGGTPGPGAIRTATATGTPGGIRTPTTGGTSTQQVYEVKSGDTASGIAATFGISVQDLAAANDLTTTDLANLRVGQSLRIPRP